MKRLKSGKGVITMITLVTVLFMISFLISSYVLVANKVKTQKEMLNETKNIYEPKFTIEEVYNSYFSSDNAIPIYTAQELLMIGEKHSNINGKYYTNDENTTYILMNDIEFRAQDFELQADWEPIDENANFLGNFEWNKHRIDVTTLNKNVNIYNGKTVITRIAYENLLQDASEEIKNAVDDGKIETVLKETINEKVTLAVVPTGYEVSKKYGEYALSQGLVITDGENEFVWIPVGTDFAETYTYNTNYFEPGELTGIDWGAESGLTFDSQDELNYWYGEGYYTYPTTDEEKNNVNNTFAYKAHYEEMVESVNKYNGFYIGRYETTIDKQGEIGSKEDTTVLTAATTLKQGTNPTSNKPYYYMWWGLYDAQRNSNIKGNKDYVQTNMIWGQQWDSIIKFLGEDQASSALSRSQSQVLKSGEATYGNSLKKDKMNNIYDLRGNAYDWTAESKPSRSRVGRGGCYEDIKPISSRNGFYPNLSSGNSRH